MKEPFVCVAAITFHMIPINICPATKLPHIRKPMEIGLIIYDISSMGTITGANQRGVPAGKKLASHVLIFSMFWL